MSDALTAVVEAVENEHGMNATYHEARDAVHVGIVDALTRDVYGVIDDAAPDVTVEIIGQSNAGLDLEVYED